MLMDAKKKRETLQKPLSLLLLLSLAILDSHPNYHQENVGKYILKEAII